MLENLFQNMQLKNSEIKETQGRDLYTKIKFYEILESSGFIPQPVSYAYKFKVKSFNKIEEGLLN